MEKNLTPQQQATIDEIVAAAGTGGGKFCVRARAGSGKTFTMLKVVDAYHKVFPNREITLCVFNKKNADETQAKLEERGYTNKRQINATTIHSMGNGLVAFRFKYPKVDKFKVRSLIEAQNSPLYREHAGNIEKLVKFAKLEGFGFFNDCQIGDTSAWYKIADHYDVNGYDDTSEMDQVVEMAQAIYKLSLAQTDVIDYDDQILFPLVKNIPVKFQKDLLILDEAQDSGRARQALINKFIKAGGCFVVVGDDRQGIYGFAGAQADALDALITAHQMKVLPLTVCFRCPKAVIREAQKLVPDIEWDVEAIEGEVTTMAALPKEILPTDAILCRNTAPLIEQAYALLRAGIACKVEGRDIGIGLLTLVNRWKLSTIDAFLNKLETYREREVQKALARNNEEKAEQVSDKCATLVHLCTVCLDRQGYSLADLRAFIDSIFADNVSGMATLCTYHRAKGREWKRVFLFEHAKRCPSRFARQDWQKAQESNLAYVAVTRAMETLVYVA